MERYSEYKDSGVKWLGEIPSHWEVEPFGRHFSFRKGLPITKANLIDSGEAVISYGQIHAKENLGTTMSESLVRYVSRDYLKSYPQCLLTKDDFVFADTSEDIGGSGNFVYNDFPANIFAGYHTIVAKQSGLYNPRYYAYLFKSECWRNHIRSLVNGVKVYSIGRKQLKSNFLLFPSCKEQDAIVRYLDAATSKIDKAIAMQQKMIDLLNERKQIIIQNAVTKGLDENVEMKDSGVEWIGMIPKHWEILKLKRCAFIKTGTTPPTNERKYFEGGRISWFTPGDMNNMHLEFASKMITQKAIDDKVGRLFPAKTIYFVGIGATVAKVSACDFEASSNQQINAIICNKSLDYRFATYVLKSEQEFIRNMANYVTLPIINQSDTGLIDMIVSPKSEQQAIVAYLDKQMQRFDSAISNCQRQIALLQERKQIIINEVVTGKVKVS